MKKWARDGITEVQQELKICTKNIQEEEFIVKEHWRMSYTTTRKILSFYLHDNGRVKTVEYGLQMKWRKILI